jgi:hypothetical protein
MDRQKRTTQKRTARKRTVRNGHSGEDSPEKDSQDYQAMTAERLWALEPGFQCYATKGGKSANL